MKEANLKSSGPEPGITLFSAAPVQDQIITKMVTNQKTITLNQKMKITLGQKLKLGAHLYQNQLLECLIEED